jgi:hypothetical protein
MLVPGNDAYGPSLPKSDRRRRTSRGCAAVSAAASRPADASAAADPSTITTSIASGSESSAAGSDVWPSVLLAVSQSHVSERHNPSSPACGAASRSHERPGWLTAHDLGAPQRELLPAIRRGQPTAVFEDAEVRERMHVRRSARPGEPSSHACPLASSGPPSGAPAPPKSDCGSDLASGQPAPRCGPPRRVRPDPRD